jgi:hypothetical protein
MKENQLSRLENKECRLNNDNERTTKPESNLLKDQQVISIEVD